MPSWLKSTTVRETFQISYLTVMEFAGMSNFGTVTWYSLCDGSNGAGASYGCPCDDNANHIAYAPAPQTGCTISNGYGCYGYLNSRNYCDYIWIYSACTATGINPSVRDCPCYNNPPNCNSCQCVCWAQTNDCSPTYAYTMADLTTYAFMYLGFQLSVGRVGVTVYD